MKRRNVLLMTALVVVSFASTPVFAVEDEWTDYDPCGWNVEGETLDSDHAVVLENEWTDYDPCGWNVEQEAVDIEVAVVSEDEWTDYDPCGWNVEQETADVEIAGHVVAGNTFGTFVK